jgi:hypothetical protein
MSDEREQVAPTPEQLRAEAERTRVALGQTAQELADKFDVPARTKDAVRQVGDQVKDTSAQAVAQVKEKWDTLPEPVRERGQGVAEAVRRRPGPVLAGVAALLVAWRVVRRRRRSR